MTIEAAEKPFVGNALARVHSSGRVRLPEFARRVLDRHPSSIFVGLHPDAPCLIAFDSRYAARLGERLEQAAENRREEAAELSQRNNRMRRLFGTTEETGWPCDRINLPEHARRRAGIDREVLFVGVGGAMEIWDPQAAAQSGDEMLEALAAWSLARAASKSAVPPLEGATL
jgi:MraZ protein